MTSHGENVGLDFGRLGSPVNTLMDRIVHLLAHMALLFAYFVHLPPYWSIYETIHIWTAVVDESEEWSSQ